MSFTFSAHPNEAVCEAASAARSVTEILGDSVRPYWRDGSTIIYHGDCREVLPELPSSSVDLILTDPPFYLPVEHHDGDAGNPRSWGDLMVMEPFFATVFRELRRVVGNGQVYVHCDGRSYPIMYRAGYSLWPHSHLIVWYKPSGRLGRGWRHAHELILHLYTAQTSYGGGFRQDVIGVMPVRTLRRQHPTEKPGELLTFLADALPKPTALVLDPFMGSGATLLAARLLGHRAIGIEIEERYCEVAAKRLSQLVLPLNGNPSGAA